MPPTHVNLCLLINCDLLSICLAHLFCEFALRVCLAQVPSSACSECCNRHSSSKSNFADNKNAQNSLTTTQTAAGKTFLFSTGGTRMSRTENLFCPLESDVGCKSGRYPKPVAIRRYELRFHRSADAGSFEIAEDYSSFILVRGMMSFAKLK